MRETLVIRSLPLDVAVYAVFRMADRWLGRQFDVLDYGEYAPVWRLVAERLGKQIIVQPRQRRLPLIGPWDLPPSAQYGNAYVLGTGARGGLDQVMALARSAAGRPMFYDIGAETAQELGERTDSERIDTECRYLPESARGSGDPAIDIRVIRIDLFGDLAYTVPLLELLKGLSPARRISLLVDQRIEPLARRLKAVDCVEAIDTSNYERFHAGLRQCAQYTAGWQILPIGGGWRRDMAAYVHRVLPALRKISRLEQDDTSDLRYAGASCTQEVVAAASMAMMIRHPAAFEYGADPKRMAQVADSVRQLIKARPLDALFRLDLQPSPAANLSIGQDDVLFAPLGGSAERDWTVTGWAQVALRTLSAIRGRLLLVGDRTARQMKFNARLARLVSSARLLNLTGQTELTDVLHAAAACGGYLGTNTAPMHLTALQGKDTVALNSPFESAELWRYPFGNHVLIPGRRLIHSWRQRDLDACIEKIWRRGLGPECDDYLYPPADVADAVLAAFQQKNRQAS